MRQKMTAHQLRRAYEEGMRDFRGSDLRDSDLRGCNLRGCNLRGSDMSGSDLRGCATNTPAALLRALGAVVEEDSK